MGKINLNEYVEEVEDYDPNYNEFSSFLIDNDHKKFEKIKHKKHHFKENRNIEKLRDKQKSHRTKRTDKI
jgi:hypothetical protein